MATRARENRRSPAARAESTPSASPVTLDADVIINSPYEEPRYHWRIEKGAPPEKREGRRPAAYFFRVPERAARGRRRRGQSDLFEQTQTGEEFPLDAANLVRSRLKEWRERGWAGASRVTRELIDLWQAEDREQRLFFAQLEAALSVVLLTEGPADLRQGVDPLIPPDEPGPQARAAGYRAFGRYALKMATGSGKTTVMGMLAAWTILNKVASPPDARYSDTVLIICPNVTIRDRLAELDPNLDGASLYRTRELVPAHRMPDLRRGEVLVTNWHNLDRREVNTVNGQSARVVQRGQPATTVRKRSGVDVAETRWLESDAAWLRRVLGGRKGRSRSICVFNDEAHHAYRRGDAGGDEVAIDPERRRQNEREATVWIEGLDRINRSLGGRGNGVRLCVDLSATPFYIQGSGNEVGKPFPWVVSDFGLLEAIESGLVKIPQLPTQDPTGAGVPAWFNVWRWVEAQAEAEGVTGALTPEVVLRYAAQPILVLAEEWRKTLEEWSRHYVKGLRRSPAPPVFIVVCRDTALAREVHAWLSGEKDDYGPSPPELRNSPGEERTVRIDSRVGDEIDAGGGSDAVQRLRFVLQTVGRTEWPGKHAPEAYEALVEKHNARALDDENVVTIDASIPPGRDVRCIVSVAMLSEGWDATTVTHIVGLRPFGSQLLCEQVVGRALRRTSYDVDPDTGFFREETAKVFGVPFELIPFKVTRGKAPPPTPPANHVFAVPEKSRYAVEFPVVEGYHDPGFVTVDLDWSKVPKLTLDSLEIPDETLLANLTSADGTLAAWGPGAPTRASLEAWRETVREQQIAFALARRLAQRWRDEHGDTIPAHTLFPRLVGFALRFMREGLECRGTRKSCDIAIAPYALRAADALYDAMTAVDRCGQTELPRISDGEAGRGSTANVDFRTGRDLWPAQKCHLNGMVADTAKWEQSAAYALDAHPHVVAWVKNDHLGFYMPSRKAGLPHRYIPDFLVKLDTGRTLVLEVKGLLGDDAEIKSAAARRWVDAVALDGRFGSWTYEVVDHPGRVLSLVDRACAAPDDRAAGKEGV